MTVAQLIELLRQLPQDAPVMTWAVDESLEPVSPPRFGEEVWWHREDKAWKATPVVVIEP